jgi:adenylate kinase
MRVAITGTPGTGKSTVCEVLSREGHKVVDLSDLAWKGGLIESPDEPGLPAIVDIERLDELPLPAGDPVFIYAHFAHLLGADTVVVLRCSPSVLRFRLLERGWNEKKIRENLEAEAIDLITVEAMEKNKNVYEVNTSSIGPEEAARQILEIVKGSVKGHEPGHVDWSEEILSWY